eukprot:1159444-Pelagomonas_calceolata.AAC.2
MPPPPAPFALVATLASSRACFKVLCMLALSIFARSGHSTAVQACLRASKRVRTAGAQAAKASFSASAHALMRALASRASEQYMFRGCVSACASRKPERGASVLRGILL